MSLFRVPQKKKKSVNHSRRRHTAAVSNRQIGETKTLLRPRLAPLWHEGGFGGRDRSDSSSSRAAQPHALFLLGDSRDDPSESCVCVVPRCLPRFPLDW